jgi:hypothetical protein
MMEIYLKPGVKLIIPFSFFINKYIILKIYMACENMFMANAEGLIVFGYITQLFGFKIIWRVLL